MIRKFVFIVALAGATAAAGAATPVPSAPGPTLTVQKGTVLVSNGSQFVTAKPGQMLHAGDRVMVMQGGSATVDYGSGHSSSLSSGTMADIGASHAMAFGSQVFAGVKKIGPMYAQAVGDAADQHCHGGSGQKGGDPDDRNHACDPYAAESGTNYAPAIITAVAVVGALSLAFRSSSDHVVSISSP